MGVVRYKTPDPMLANKRMHYTSVIPGLLKHSRRIFAY
jgi:hypothetical protein